MIHLRFAEDKPQRVAEIFERVMAPPCPIDGELSVFSTRKHANTYLFLLSFVSADNLESELTYKFDVLRASLLTSTKSTIQRAPAAARVEAGPRV